MSFRDNRPTGRRQAGSVFGNRRGASRDDPILDTKVRVSGFPSPPPPPPLEPAVSHGTSPRHPCQAFAFMFCKNVNLGTQTSSAPEASESLSRWRGSVKGTGVRTGSPVCPGSHAHTGLENQPALPLLVPVSARTRQGKAGGQDQMPGPGTQGPHCGTAPVPPGLCAPSGGPLLPGLPVPRRRGRPPTWSRQRPARPAVAGERPPPSPFGCP